MKKTFALLLSTALLLTLAACSKEQLPHTHSYTSTVTSTVSCATDGITTFSCTCGHSYTETIPALGHDYEVTGTIAQTCTEWGGIIKTCVTCGKAVREVVPPHTWGEWQTVTEPTENTEGKAEKTCTGCGKTIYKLLDTTSELSEIFRELVENSDHILMFEGTEYITAFQLVRLYGSILNGTLTASVTELDELTQKYYGQTWDYTGFDNDTMDGWTNITYNAAEGTVTAICKDDISDDEELGTGEGVSFQLEYCGFYAVGLTHYTITYQHNYTDENWEGGEPFQVNIYQMIVEKIGENYVVTYHSRVA